MEKAIGHSLEILPALLLGGFREASPGYTILRGPSCSGRDRGKPQYVCICSVDSSSLNTADVSRREAIFETAGDAT
jgi:hypothetical protein